MRVEPKPADCMLPRLITRIAYGIAVCAGLLLLAVLWQWLMAPGELEEAQVRRRSAELPRNAFEQPAEVYDQLGEHLLQIQMGPPELELPELSRYLLFSGVDGRPDAQQDNPALHLQLRAGRDSAVLEPGGRLYLVYDRSIRPPQYTFSPDNRETPLWIEGYTDNGEAVIQVRMRNERGQILTDPPERATIRLAERRFRPTRAADWQLNGQRVDGTLLARQKARWHGKDLFFQLLGGEDYAYLAGKQRIDFEPADHEPYSIFVGEEDCVVWDEGRWRSVELGPESVEKPLLCLNRITDRLMNLTLWDVGGSRKMQINLIRATDMWSAQILDQDFRFVGAKTRRQTIVEVRGEKMTLRPQDWLLLTAEGWRKLSSLEEIDRYVNRELIGVLFIFEGVEKREDEQVLAGTVFNSSRSSAYNVELSLGGSKPVKLTPVEFESTDAQTDNRETRAVEQMAQDLIPERTEDNDGRAPINIRMKPPRPEPPAPADQQDSTP